MCSFSCEDFSKSLDLPTRTSHLFFFCFQVVNLTSSLEGLDHAWTGYATKLCGPAGLVFGLPLVLFDASKNPISLDNKLMTVLLSEADGPIPRLPAVMTMVFGSSGVLRRRCIGA